GTRRAGPGRPSRASASALDSSLFLLVDGDRVLRPPLEQDATALLLERVRRGPLQVLTHDGERPAVVELDDVPREDADVHDVANASGLGARAGIRRLSLVEHP